MILLNLGSAGCPAPAAYSDGYEEVHVDLAQGAQVRADVRSLPYADESVDAIYASHLIEHFHEHEVVPLLVEWRRVLKPGGKIHVSCPDGLRACELAVERGMDTVVYEAVNGAQIRPVDMIFGWTHAVANDGPLMAHHTMFDQKKLASVFFRAGFRDGGVARDELNWELVAQATK